MFEQKGHVCEQLCKRFDCFRRKGTFLHSTYSETIDVQLLLVNKAAVEDGWYFGLIGLGEVVAWAHGYCAVSAHASRTSVHISEDQVYVLLRSIVNRTADWLQVASFSCPIDVALVRP